MYVYSRFDWGLFLFVRLMFVVSLSLFCIEECLDYLGCFRVIRPYVLQQDLTTLLMDISFVSLKHNFLCGVHVFPVHETTNLNHFCGFDTLDKGQKGRQLWYTHRSEQTECKPNFQERTGLDALWESVLPQEQWCVKMEAFPNAVTVSHFCCLCLSISFERLLLHAVCQYMDLVSASEWKHISYTPQLVVTLVKQYLIFWIKILNIYTWQRRKNNCVILFYFFTWTVDAVFFA